MNLKKLISFHIKKKKLVTVTAVRPPARFGELFVLGNKVVKFKEKQQMKRGWINGGFFVLSPNILSTISGPSSIWEQEPLKKLAKDGQLMAFKHDGFWQPMDTLRDKNYLENLWEEERAPWKLW